MSGVKQNSAGKDAHPGGGLLWKLTAGERMRYAAAIVAMGVGTVFLLLVPYVLKSALDALTSADASLTADARAGGAGHRRFQRLARPVYLCARPVGSGSE